MNHTTSKIVRISAVAVAVGMLGAWALQAQQPAPAAAPQVKRNIVLKQDMTIPDREGIMALVEIPVGAEEGRHTHFAEVYAFLLEGQVSLENEGNPTTTLKAGDVFHILPGKIHNARNTGTVPAKLAAVFVAEKGKPLTTPAK
jgi:quercetin dioxygenase-like cupin family protein